MAVLTSFPPKIDQHMMSVMASMGWDDKAFVPIANESNKKLMVEIKWLQEVRAKKSSLQEMLKERVVWLKQHIDHCHSDVSRNMNLINAHRIQLETEENMCKLAKNQEEAHRKEMKDTERSFDDLKKRSNFTEGEIEKIQKRMEETTSDINWMKVALEEWKDAAKNGEEINQIMDQFTKEDQKKMDSLETKRGNIETDINKYRQQLSDAYEEQKSLEKVLDNTAQMYQKTHMERQELIGTWRKAVADLHAREKMIQSTMKEIEYDQEITEKRREELAEQNEFLEQQIRNNKEIEQAIEELNKRAVELRTLNTRMSDGILTASSELMTLKKSLRNLTNHLQQVRQKNRQIQKNIEEKTKQIASSKEDVKVQEEKIRKFTNLNMDASERLKSLDEMVEAEEKAIHYLVLETSRLCGVLYRSQQLLQQWQNDQKLVQNEIHLHETTIKAIIHSHSTYQKEMQHQTEIFYDVKLKLFEVERRVAKMRGSAKVENPELIVKLNEVENRHDEALRNEKLLKLQLSDVEDNLRKIKTLLEHDTSAHECLDDRLKEKLLNYEGAVRQLAKMKDDSNEKLVENSLMKMKVHQLAEREKRLLSNSFNMEKHKYELELAINERLVAIQTEINMLTIQKKLFNEEKSQLKADIADRKRNIEVMKARFELASQLLGRTEDGEVISTVQWQIKMAQEKEMLLDQGSSLNDKVIQAEKDIIAMENTLIMMNFSNDKYKRGLQLVEDVDEDDMAEITAMNEQLTQSQNQFKVLKANVVMKTRLLEEIKIQCSQIEKDLEDIRQSRIASNDDLIKIHNEIFEQKSKRERAEREMKNARKAMIQKVGDKNYISCFEKDVKAKELEERNTSALQQLSEMVDSVMGLGPVVTKHLYEKGLQMPPLAGSSIHSASSRAKSDITLRSLRRHSEQSNSSTSSTPASTAKSGRIVLEKRASIVTLDFPGDDTIRSLQTNRAANSKSS